MISSLLCDAATDGHILNTPNWSISLMNYVAIFFPFIKLTAEPDRSSSSSVTGPVPSSNQTFIWVSPRFTVNSVFIVCLGGFVHRLAYKRTLPSLQFIHNSKIDSILSGLWCRKWLKLPQNRFFFFYIVTFLLPFPACWSREKVRVFSLSFLLFLVGHSGAKSTASGLVTNINYSFIPLRCDGSRALVLCMLGHRHRSVERESSLVLSDPPVPILISCGKPLLSLFLFFLSSWFDCLIEASSTSQIQWQRVSGSIGLTGECHLHMNQ